jgi:DNA-binding NarL/FixJ family response regulator
MPHRVREILLVSSPYDAFTLEEDGRLTERLFLQYSELSLSMAPRITHAPTGTRAMELLKERRFDLVITMVRLADADPTAFGRRVKALDPRLPVVLLSMSEADLKRYPGEVDRSVLDGVFVWTGDARILLAIVKLIEDVLNVEHDTRLAGVQVIIVAEDSVRRYSSFLTLLYVELMSQSASLVAEGINAAHKLMRMRARPKILLATSFEEAVRAYERFPDHAYALITDIRLPRRGVEDDRAGFDLVDKLRAEDPELPVLVQSTETDNLIEAESLGLHAVDKTSAGLVHRIRDFLVESLGFGDFIFRLPDRTEVARARNVFEMEDKLRTISVESVEFHGSRNHFSLWLMARGMFELASLLKPRTISEFGGVEGARQHILSVLSRARMQEQAGLIADFSEREAGAHSTFVRVGHGSIGGKARGIAFFNSLLSRQSLPRSFPNLEIRTPRTVALGTDVFDRFMDMNGLHEISQRIDSDRDILARFLWAKLPDDALRDLEIAWRDLSGPLAVRSSSLLEDSQFLPFAGVYSTYMVTNDHPSPHVRFDELRRAIKAVYCSAFSRSARAYIEGTPYSQEEEKMGVLIQELVGRRHGMRFYPAISGVALSYNYYPIGMQQPEDGVALLALGLGQKVVEGGAVFQFSPRWPGNIPQLGSAAEITERSQSTFYALDMSSHTIDFAKGPSASLGLYPLEDAEADGTLKLVGSTYSPEDDVIRDTLATPGPRVVTFNNILKWEAIPLAPALDELLRAAKQSMGCAVEIEFALDAGDSGEPSRLYALQIRPQVTQIVEMGLEEPTFPEDDVLCRSPRSLGHGVIRGIQDVVYVKRYDSGAITKADVAAAVEEINQRLVSKRAPYLLIGPGRWGSSDPYLGIPVEWPQIAGARLIVETSFRDRAVEPSQGSHFFHNITSLHIGYLTVRATDRDDPGSFVDLAWLDGKDAQHENALVRHVRFDRPVVAYLDGKTGRAVVLKPA